MMSRVAPVVRVSVVTLKSNTSAPGTPGHDIPPKASNERVVAARPVQRIVPPNPNSRLSRALPPKLSAAFPPNRLVMLEKAAEPRALA